MKKEDIEFRKKCQLYYMKTKNFLKEGKLNEAESIVGEINNKLREWEDHIKSVRFKINLLRSLSADMAIAKKRVGKI
jgi:hypothetical protein